jgi:hypothetical protein
MGEEHWLRKSFVSVIMIISIDLVLNKHMLNGLLVLISTTTTRLLWIHLFPLKMLLYYVDTHMFIITNGLHL